MTTPAVVGSVPPPMRALAFAVLLAPALAAADATWLRVDAEESASAAVPFFGAIRVGWQGLPDEDGAFTQARADTTELALSREALPLAARGTLALRAELHGFSAFDADRAFADGLGTPGRAFAASRARFGAATRHTEAPGRFVELALFVGAQRFTRGRHTAEALVLPEDALTLSPELRLAWRSVGAKEALPVPARGLGRLEGAFLGLSLSGEWRSARAPWGLAAPGGWLPERPGPLSAGARLEAGAARRFFELLRPDLRLHAAAGTGQDALARAPIGGLTRDGTPLPGLPFAAARPTAHAGGLLKLALGPLGGVEFGPQLAAIVRSTDAAPGRDELRLEQGVGAFLELRRGGLSLELQGGVSPTAESRTDRPAWSVAAGLGWAAP